MRKYLFSCFFIFILCISLFGGIKVNATFSLVGKIIIIDVGHGGKDPGSIVSNTIEKDINLTISEYLESELSRNGAIVIKTRDGDYDLSKPNAVWRKKSDFDNRIKLINNSSADMYISIHLNYLEDKSYKGPQVFYNTSNKDNESIAKIMQETMNKSLNGDREYKRLSKTIYMFNKLDVKGVLIECGFLSNYNERNLLKSKKYQKKIAKAISDGVINYFNY
ncbi:MAG: N-acetylmuramoyl-L-alanine amidase [Bacilli bacterium]|nr:N-acetylmuramoyl-L-alanine amidase [Bacilli bacterium]